MPGCVFVDDDKWALLDMRDSFPLAEYGFTVTGSYTVAEDALEALRKEHADLLIADICMRGMDGLTLMRICLQEGLVRQFIFVSGHDSFTFAQHALNQGAAYYLLKPVNPMEAAKALKKVSALLNAQDSAMEDTESQDSVMRVVDYINEHYMEPLTLSQIADMFYLNMNYLSEQFRLRTGKTFSQYRGNLRIARAKVLLKNGYSVAEVAEKIGYDDAHYFSRVFLQQTGCTPKEYKKRQEKT